MDSQRSDELTFDPIPSRELSPASEYEMQRKNAEYLDLRACVDRVQKHSKELCFWGDHQRELVQVPPYPPMTVHPQDSIGWNAIMDAYRSMDGYANSAKKMQDAWCKLKVDEITMRRAVELASSVPAVPRDTRARMNQDCKDLHQGFISGNEHLIRSLDRGQDRTLQDQYHLLQKDGLTPAASQQLLLSRYPHERERLLRVHKVHVVLAATAGTELFGEDGAAKPKRRILNRPRDPQAVPKRRRAAAVKKEVKKE